MTGSFALLLAIVLSDSEAFGQTPSRVEQFAKVVQELQTSGRRVERPRAVVWFSPHEMNSRDGERLADAISESIGAVERLLRLSLGRSPIEYFVTREFGATSHYYPAPPRIFLDLTRIQSGESPYVHETVHHLVFTHAKIRAPSGHIWLLEGFPNYVQGEIARSAGRVREAGMIVANQRVDAEALAIIGTALGRDLVSFVGRTGAPPNLYTDAEQVRRPYYVLAQSFTKYLVETISLQRFTSRLVQLMLHAARFDAKVQELTGKTVEQLRLEWLAHIERTPR